MSEGGFTSNVGFSGMLVGAMLQQAEQLRLERARNDELEARLEKLEQLLN